MESAHPADHKPAGKNLVICCDGTGNEISENISNVLKLYRCLRKTDKTSPRQMVFYDPGVGTMTEPSTWGRWKANIKLVWGLATGYGLDDNVLSSYCFLVQHYAPGDKIYLFGFSRGAYTVRVLAGLIHKIGLISPEQANLAGSGLIAYKQYSGSGRGNDVEDIKNIVFDESGPLPKDEFDLAALADHPFRRRLGHGGERDRAARRSLLLAEPGGARLHTARPQHQDLPAGDRDRRAAAHVPPEALRGAAGVLEQSLRA